MKKARKRILSNLESENLDRFAGSSDEEGEEKPMAPPVPLSAVQYNDSDVERKNDDKSSDSDDVVHDGYHHGDEYMDSKERNKSVGIDVTDDLSSVEGEEPDPASKMANAMSTILGTENKRKNDKAPMSSSVVLAKTVTPLQKLQQKEKEKQKVMKEKRKSNRERNLTALHLPLSIATTNNIESGGQLSVAKELEQERFHRRVATRGVVALFNAITQHQRNSVTDVCNPFTMNIFLLRALPYLFILAHYFECFCSWPFLFTFLFPFVPPYRKMILICRRRRKHRN